MSLAWFLSISLQERERTEPNNILPTEQSKLVAIYVIDFLCYNSHWIPLNCFGRLIRWYLFYRHQRLSFHRYQERDPLN